jgi:FtsH-binding integral membrane protein
MDRFNSAPLPYPGAGTASAAERITTFLRAAYGWMAAGLAVTAVVALFIASSEELVFTIARNRILFWGLAIAQLGSSSTCPRGSTGLRRRRPRPCFLGYSALTGVTFSIILYAYTRESVATTFFVTAGMFGALAHVWHVTSRSLAGWGQFLFMG